jgi:hypothetical protein
VEVIMLQQEAVEHLIIPSIFKELGITGTQLILLVLLTQEQQQQEEIVHLIEHYFIL